MTTDNQRSQSRKPQVISVIHEQPPPRSENPWILGSTSCAEVRQCEAARVGRYAPTPRQQAAACRQALLGLSTVASRCASTEGRSDNKNYGNGSSCLRSLTCSAVQGAGGSNGPHVMQLPENSASQKETSPLVNFAPRKETSPPTNFAPVK